MTERDDEIEGCPCGKAHHLPDDYPRDYFEGSVPVKLLHDEDGAAYLVPRIYIAYHGLRAIDLEPLANLYGWTRVS